MGAWRMNDRIVGIFLSGMFHVAVLSLVIFLPPVKGGPVKTFQIRFEQQESFESSKPVSSAVQAKSVVMKRRQAAIPQAEEKRPVTMVVRDSRIDGKVRPLTPVPPGPGTAIQSLQDLPVPSPSTAVPTRGAVADIAGPKNGGTSAIPGPTVSQKGEGSSIVETKFGELDAPAFIHRATPVYPRVARRLEKEGRVVLKLLIDRTGALRSVEVIEAAPFGFTEAAVEAVRRSTFAPAQRNAEGVSSWAVLPIRFNLE